MNANTYRVQKNSKPNITTMIVFDFLEQLRSWWDNYLTIHQKHEIMTAIKRKPDGTPSLGNPSDTVVTLILNILYHFVGDCVDIYEKLGNN